VGDDRDPVWKKFLGWLLLPVVLLVAIIVIPILNLLGLNKKNAKPEYVIDYLEKFIAGTESGWDWDDFSSIPLTDPTLEDIRQRACEFGPWAVGELAPKIEALRGLLEEARAVQRDSG